MSMTLYGAMDPLQNSKTKYCMMLLHCLSKDLQKNMSWKCFATSHGKGVIDGIGGRAKSLVRQAVMSKANNIIVQSAQDFTKEAAKLMPSTTVLYVSEAETQTFTEKSNLWNGELPIIPGISKMHVAYHDYDFDTIMCFENAKAPVLFMAV